MLRETREARGLTIAEVAQHLKLTPRQVEAMEAGDLAHLPGPAFARGFVRNYARFLHLDPAHFNHVLDVVREVPTPMNTLPLGQMPGPARWRFSALPALGIAAGLLALAVAGWYYRWFEPRDEQYLADMMSQSGVLAEPVSAPLASAPVAAPAQSAPAAPTSDMAAASAAIAAPSSAPVASSVPVVAVAPLASAPVAVPPTASAPRAVASSSVSSAAASVAAASTVAIPTTPAVPKAASAPLAQSAALSGPVPKGSHRLHFAFDADAWVEVRDANGKVVFSRLNPAGSEQDVQGEAPLQVVIGNAPQVRLNVDGKAQELGSHTSSNVARLSLP
jgi:cytoskeleton protein RodZ